MKKIIALLLAVVMLSFAFAGCGAKGKSLDDVKNAGELVIATSPDFPPFEFLEGEEVVGIEADILTAVCEKLGVELKIEQMDFDSVLPGVQAGKFDMGVSGISVTPEREKNTDFTNAYCLAAQTIVVLEGSPITGKADLEGKKVSVQTGTTSESSCTEEGLEISAFTANNDAQAALTTGKVDAWVVDDLTAKEMVDAYNAENPETELVILEEPLTTEPYAFAFIKSDKNDTLVDEINKILADMVADGTIEGIFEKYDAPYTSPANK